MNDKQKEILNQVRDEIQCIHISAQGVQSYNKSINIADIIKKYSIETLIPCTENFEFFNFEHAKKVINDEYREKVDNPQNKNANMGRFIEERDESLKKVDIYISEYEKLKKLCNKINSVVNDMKSKYIMDFYDSTKIIEKSSLEEIMNEVNKLKNSEVDKVILNEGINFLKIMFESIIIKGLKHYKTIEGLDEQKSVTEEVEYKIREKMNSIDSGADMVEKIKCNIPYVLDIAEETLLNEGTRLKVVKALRTFNKQDLAKKVENFIKL